MINYVRRTLQPVVLKSASNDAQFGDDEYIVANKARSVVCMPILLKNSLKVFNVIRLPLFSFYSPFTLPLSSFWPPSDHSISFYTGSDVP